MKKEDGNSNGGGLGFSAVLTIIFVVLKLTGVIKWSWLWVLAPMWIMLIVMIILVAVLLIIKRKH